MSLQTVLALPLMLIIVFGAVALSVKIKRSREPFDDDDLPPGAPA
jgi:hypothetical protein